MTTFFLTLIGLSAVLTFSSAVTILLRKTAIGRRGSIMNTLWAAILLLAIIPLPLPADALPYHLFGAEDSAALIRVSSETLEMPYTTSDEEILLRTESASSSSAAADPARTEKQERPSFPLPFVLLVLYLGGAIVTFLYFLGRSASSGASLRACSHVCTDQEIIRQCSALVTRCRLRRSPELRILDDGICYSPCTTGIFSPCVYLPSTLRTEDIPAVLAHELCHIKRRDTLRRLFSVTVVSLHWFNPVAHYILPLVHEDMEQSCDNAALCLLGGGSARRGYMQALLRIACMSSPSPSAAPHFFSHKQQTNAVKRRFLNMQHPVRRISATLVSLLLIGTMLLSSAVIFTACGSPGRRDPLRALTPLTEFILRYYHDLSPEDEITREMCEAITSLELSVMFYDDPGKYWYKYQESYASSNIDENVAALIASLQKKTLLNFKVNAHDAPAGSYDALVATQNCWLNLMRSNFFENTFVAAIPDEWNSAKTKAFYDLLDINLEETEENKAKLIEEFPGIQFCPSYIYDTSADFPSLFRMHSVCNNAGIFDALWLDGTVIDTDAIAAAFPNLEHLELIGLTAAE